MASSDVTTREMLVAVPGDTDDIYRRHQQVWSAMAVHVKAGHEFLYRQESSRLVRIRSESLPTGRIASLRAGATRLDLVVSDRYDGNKERDVPRDHATDWTVNLLVANGFDVRTVELVQYRIVTGCKPAKGGVPGHRIRYATATFKLDLAIRNLFEAQRAWRTGIGRGRRFGFGMLICEQQ